MLPSFLFPSYKQYKTDSNAVITWLGNTAQRCGYSKDLLTSQAASQRKTPRLTGRARKLARDNKSDNLKSTTTPEGAEYLIAVKDFISLAEYIVSSTKPRIKVPASLVTVLDRAIAARKRHHSWWYSQSEKNGSNAEKEKQANERHGYFIGVLEKVREVLQPRMPTELLKDPLAQLVEGAPASKQSTNGHIVDLFENLDIEEPSDAFLNYESAPSGEKPIQYGVNQVPDLEEAYFAVHCLFNDLDNIRRYLQQVWKGYKEGKFDLIAASITTNTAIEFARRLQEDFIEMFPKHTDFEKHINVLYLRLCLAHDQDPEFKERPDDEMNFAVYEDAEAMLFPTYMLVSSFNDMIEPGIMPMYKPGHYGVYEASSDRASKPPRDKFREDKIVLLEILPDFCVLALGTESIPAEDEMTRGMREMVKHTKLPIWLVFAAQIFLDIHHTLREKVSSAFYDLVRSSGYVENSIQRVLKFHDNLRSKNWPKSNDHGLFQILDRITSLVKIDVVQDARTRLTRGSGFQPPSAEAFLLLKRHPLYCGLLSYSIKALAQEASIVFVNAWGSVLSTAHLYNALRQERLISNAWQDMDLALLMHRTEDIFIGGLPKTIDDYLKRFSLAIGCSATMFAKNRRKAGLVASKAGPRVLNDISPVSRMFKTRYCGNEDRTNLSPDDVDIILKKHTGGDDHTDSAESNEWKIPNIAINIPEETPAASATNGTKPSKPQPRSRKTQISAATGVRPIQLLNALLEAIQSEMLELTFDHFHLHIFSWCLLRGIKLILDDDLRNIYGPGYLEEESQLPYIVGYIFMTAVQTSKLAGVQEPKKTDVVTSRILVRAAAVVMKILEVATGGVEVEIPDLGELAGSRNANSGDAGEA